LGNDGFLIAVKPVLWNVSLLLCIEALVDRIAREPGFRSMADVARWLEGMRVDTGERLDREVLMACAEHYGRPSVRWLLRFVDKNPLT
jgi:hypothetical protein